MRVLAVLALAVITSSARAEEAPVRFHGSVQLRARADQDVPGTSIRWDPAQGAFALSGYLRPQGQETAGSLLASLGLEGVHRGGDLRWVLTVDTGELRSQRQHRRGHVCWSDATPSGLATPGSGDCALFRLGRALWTRVSVPVEETAVRGPELTSNGRPFAEEVKRTLLLREAYATYRFGRAGFLSVTAGRKRMVVGDGYIHDDYATGLALDADVGAIGPQWDLSAAIFQPTRDLPRGGRISPMAVIRADYLPSLFDRAGVFVAGLRERSDSLASVYRGAVEERLVVAAEGSEPGTLLHRRANQLLAAAAAADLRSDGTLGWAGTSGKLTVGQGQRLAWTAALLAGTIHSVQTDVRDTPLAEEIRLRGQLASVRWDLDLARSVSAGASFLYLSGDELPGAQLAGGKLTPASGTYRAFVGVSPYLTETSIFFGGGLSESYADRQVLAPGVNGRGVIAPGASLRWDPTEHVTAQAKGAWLRAAAKGPFGGRQYGTEVDLSVSWEAARWLLLGLEADALFPGDFFRGRAPITRGILAVDVLAP